MPLLKNEILVPDYSMEPLVKDLLTPNLSQKELNGEPVVPLLLASSTKSDIDHLGH